MYPPGDEFGVIAGGVMPLFKQPLKWPGIAGGNHAGVEIIEFSVAPRHMHHVHRFSGGTGFGDHVDRIAGDDNAVRQAQKPEIGVVALEIPYYGGQAIQCGTEGLDIFRAGAPARNVKSCP